MNVVVSLVRCVLFLRFPSQIYLLSVYICCHWELCTSHIATAISNRMKKLGAGCQLNKAVTGLMGKFYGSCGDDQEDNNY